MEERAQRYLNRIQLYALVVGVVGLLAGVVGIFFSVPVFFQSYLFAYTFWTGMALGCLCVLLFHHVTGGRWGFALRRFLEAGALTMPVMGLLFVPLAFGLPYLYEWARPEEVALDPLLLHKAPYLNATFFLMRTAVYFLIWSVLAVVLVRWSRRQDETAEAALTHRSRQVATAGLIVLLFTASLAGVDWLMSLEPHWYSHVYGLLFLTGQALAALAFVLSLVVLLRRQPDLQEVLDVSVYDDLGNFLLAFLLFWIYLAFMEFLVIWSANIPEEVTYFVRRTETSWGWVALFFVLLHFAFPFLLLILRGALIHRARTLLGVGVLITAVHLTNVYWLILPAFYPEGIVLLWPAAAWLVGLGGVWTWLYARFLGQAALLPRHDPRLEEILQHE